LKIFSKDCPRCRVEGCGGQVWRAVERENLMTRHPIVGLSLAATLLASCAQNGEVGNRAAPPAAKTQDEASADVVVSGTRISGRVAAESSLYAPPPPPPPAMVAPGIYMPQAVSPPYHDQGRDKFASFEQNIFK